MNYSLRECNINDLKFLLEDEKVSALVIKNKEKRIDIIRKISIYMNFDDLSDERNGQLIDKGYQVNINEETIDFESFEQLLEFLKLEDQQLIALLSINNQFNSIQEYLEDKAFNNLDMQGIISKYEKEADSFVLVAPYEEELLDEMYVEFGDDSKSETINDLENKIITKLKGYYDIYLDDIKKTTNKSFETIIDDIKQEIRKALMQAERDNVLMFLCDKVHVGKTLYQEPQQFFWHAYHDLQFLIECESNIDLVENNQFEYLEKNTIINDLRTLKPWLISFNTSYSWHCTTTNRLSIVFKFQLNEETKKYLLKFKTDYDLKGLEDLAFYKGEKLLFSSCTHERFHADIK